MGDLDELPALLIQLRELIGEAHAAVKDLTPLIREHRRIADDAAQALLSRIEVTVNAEVGKMTRHLQAEQNAASADLNQAVNEAREHIVRCLTPGTVTVGPDGKLEFTFNGNFQEDPPPPRRHRPAPKQGR